MKPKKHENMDRTYFEIFREFSLIIEIEAFTNKKINVLRNINV